MFLSYYWPLLDSYNKNEKPEGEVQTQCVKWFRYTCTGTGWNNLGHLCHKWIGVGEAAKQALNKMLVKEKVQRKSHYTITNKACIIGWSLWNDGCNEIKICQAKTSLHFLSLPYRGKTFKWCYILYALSVCKKNGKKLWPLTYVYRLQSRC